MIALLIKTHFVDQLLLEKLAEIALSLEATPWVELILSLDTTRQIPHLPLNAELARILKRLKLHLFDQQSHLKNQLRPTRHFDPKKSSINWYHSDYSLLDFYLLNSKRYTHYWQIEYDVYLQSGSWSFLAQDWQVDFLASSIKAKDVSSQARVLNECLLYPEWHWWGMLEQCEPRLGCFFPCVMLSARALECLLEAYTQGVAGYCEVSVPSVLAETPELKLMDLSVIELQQARICHPHWERHLKHQAKYDFVLNQSGLNVL